MISTVVAGVRARPAAAMAVATAFSRATGFGRTLALAWVLGVSSLADAYNLANTAPNMLFQLAAGGVLSSAVVPLLSQAATPELRRENANVIFGGVLAVGAISAVVLGLVAPFVLVALTAGSDGADRADMVRVGTTFLILFSPQVLAYAVSVFCVGVLTSHRRLFLGAFAPILTNLFTIVGVGVFVFLGRRRPGVSAVQESQVLWLGLLTTVGVVAMAAWQLLGATRAEPGLRPSFRLRHDAVRHAVRLAPWVGLYVAVNQLGLAVVIALAARVAGGVSAYQWAFAVMQLPHALIAVSIVTASFPRIAKDAASDPDATSSSVNRALRQLSMYLLPAAAALGGLAPTIAVAIVGPDGAELVAAALVGFAFSLLPFSIFQLLTRASYAYRDARTPALVNIWVNLVNVGVNVLAVMVTDTPVRLVAGLALGHATSYAVGAWLLARRLRARHGVAVRRPPHFARGLIAAAALAGALAAAHLAWQPRSQVSAAAALALVFTVVAVPIGLRRRLPTGGVS